MEDTDVEKFLRELRGIFIDSCEDAVKSAEKYLEALYENINLKEGAVDVPETLKSLRRIAHNLKGEAGTCGFPAISVISHRLEDYLSNLDTPTVAQIKDLYAFFDQIQDALKKGDTISVDEMVRGLPVYQSPKESEQKYKTAIASIRAGSVFKKKPSSLEAMLIMPSSKLQRKVLGYELAACGFRVTNVFSSPVAIDMALRIKPDLILSGQVIDNLITGVELAQIFSLMETTKDTPFILLTSFSRQSKELRNLPANVRVARKNEHFLDDLSKCLQDANFKPRQKDAKK